MSECPQCKLLLDYLSARVGGECVGDALIRLTGDIVCIKHDQYVSTEDWREWLRDLGRRLNEADEKEHVVNGYGYRACALCGTEDASVRKGGVCRICSATFFGGGPATTDAIKEVKAEFFDEGSR